MASAQRPAGAGPALARLRAGLRARRAALGNQRRSEADARIAALIEVRVREWLGRWEAGIEGGRSGEARAAGPAGAANTLKGSAAAGAAGETDAYPGPRVLAAFWPIGEEPDLRPLLARLAADPRLCLALPVIERRAAPLGFRLWTPGAAMRAGDYGIPEPADAAPARPDIVLVPTLGFTAQGDRIGYGGGFYDRTLAQLRRGGAVTAFGVAYACGALGPDEHVPAPHDARLDAVVTENGWVPAGA
ncbi:hypothetical protein GCM10023144_06110 [Pigmentiphaga soli]|uniref:5-formyltetrahydrofolate cyclo-ligase n=1 Tax=Pigmentiphaga soli TaxID=1007095 RepID=A0ABP8GHH7_9BURK